MQKPSSNHWTLRLPHDDENDWLKFSSAHCDTAEYTCQVMILNFDVGIQCHPLCSVTLGAW